MTIQINLTGLHNIYKESILRNEPTICFPMINGHGNFLFMMFFDQEDDTTKDFLYLFLRNTNEFLTLKMYGDHMKGKFDVYFTDAHQTLIRNELQLGENAGNAFSFDNFFSDINSALPQALTMQNKIEALRNSWEYVSPHLPQDIVEDSLKTILIGQRQLPSNKAPREKTLRKLYLYGNGTSDEITKLIEILKKLNKTVCWTHDINRATKSINAVINETKSDQDTDK